MQAVNAKKVLILQSSLVPQIFRSMLSAGFELEIEGRFNGSADKDTDHKLILCLLHEGVTHCVIGMPMEFSWKKRCHIAREGKTVS